MYIAQADGVATDRPRSPIGSEMINGHFPGGGCPHPESSRINLTYSRTRTTGIKAEGS